MVKHPIDPITIDPNFQRPGTSLRCQPATLSVALRQGLGGQSFHMRHLDSKDESTQILWVERATFL